LAQNLLLAGFILIMIFLGKYTYEFLDVNPANILINESNVPHYGKYVLTNFGLTFAGTKFFRRYLCPSDPFFSEGIAEKSVPNVIFTYSFQTAMVVLYFIFGINTNDFYEDGRF
jgi:hypothetical protein